VLHVAPFCAAGATRHHHHHHNHHHSLGQQEPIILGVYGSTSTKWAVRVEDGNDRVLGAEQVNTRVWGGWGGGRGGAVEPDVCFICCITYSYHYAVLLTHSRSHSRMHSRTHSLTPLSHIEWHWPSRRVCCTCDAGYARGHWSA
jgi:hypothetical protein